MQKQKQVGACPCLQELSDLSIYTSACLPSTLLSLFFALKNIMVVPACENCCKKYLEGADVENLALPYSLRPAS